MTATGMHTGATTMDLILWRHAEAQAPADGCKDFERRLTARGRKQAARMGHWLERQLPDSIRVLSSPLRRCEETARALGRKYKLRAELAPDGTSAELLQLVQWPASRQSFLIVSHQPLLGRVITQLLDCQMDPCAVRKASIWWLRHRYRDGQQQTVLVAVQSPDTL